MRIVFFGSGSPLSVIALRELARSHTILAVVTPRGQLRLRDRLRRRLGLRPPDPLEELARTTGAALVRKQSEVDSAAHAADLVVVASFPKLIPSSIFRAARLGGINLHQSLLPRGRGPDPLFWTYYDNESDAGSSVHRLDEDFDSGDLLAQEQIVVERGRSIFDLYFELAEVGSRQLAETVNALGAGSVVSRRQDPALATRRPSPLKTQWRVPFDVWPAERTWHFLSGIGDMFGHLCRDPNGAPMPVGRATHFSNERHLQPPGTFERTGERLRLYCPDGIVHVNLERQRR